MRRPIKGLLLAGLAIAVGVSIAYAVDNHTDGAKITGKGLGMGTDPVSDARYITFPDAVGYSRIDFGGGSYIQYLNMGLKILSVVCDDRAYLLGDVAVIKKLGSFTTEVVVDADGAAITATATGNTIEMDAYDDIDMAAGGDVLITSGGDVIIQLGS